MPELPTHRKDRPDESCACSTGTFQEFRDVEGGAPLDSPEVVEREKLRNAKRDEAQDSPTEE